MHRCKWVNPANELYVKYHDEEWGRPLHDDHQLFELLILEGCQAGLSWETILNKRENYRRAYKVSTHRPSLSSMHMIRRDYAMTQASSATV